MIQSVIQHPFLQSFRHRLPARFQFGFGWLICLFVVLGNVAWAPAESAHKQTVWSVADSRPAQPSNSKNVVAENPAQSAKSVGRGSRSKSASARKSGQGQFALREGTKIIDLPGYFRITGDRAIFYSNRRNSRYVALENLNLERIVAAMADQPRQRKWKVTGTLTEYRGENYLLVEKAVLESWGETVRHSP